MLCSIEGKVQITADRHCWQNRFNLYRKLKSNKLLKLHVVRERHRSNCSLLNRNLNVLFVSKTVLPHAAGVIETFVAQWARIRLFSRMYTGVHRQRVFHCERLVTVGTRIRSLSTVNSFVVGEMRALPECLGALLTLVRLFVRVDKAVCPVDSSGCKRLFTDGTGVWPFTGMCLKWCKILVVKFMYSRQSAAVWKCCETYT